MNATASNSGTALPRKVLVLGSSALTIGQAGEFDYSGSQAIKALREEGIACILINPNIATIQTSEGLADEVYFLPVTPEYVERIIVKEKPDAILLGFGGQTALNCGLELEAAGVLQKYGIRVLGTPIDTIRTTEDRGLFNTCMRTLDVKVPKSEAVHNLEGALAAADAIGYPVMMRSGFSLGGLGSGMCADAATLRERAEAAFVHVPQVLVEEWLNGWKEVEYEVVRDAADNCITVCNMENVDPLGIHTGESFVVAPSQTLSDVEYHKLRSIAIHVVRSLGVVGECNIQYALDPHSDDYRVIEVNARLSRSSALASKATGYPLAFVAAKLGLGQLLTDVPNKVTGVTQACFEPALDYVVVKAPRWDLQKFQGVSTRLGSAMKSVGEVMAIGRSFEEALQKSVRMLEVGPLGVLPPVSDTFDDLEKELAQPTDRRMFAIARAFKQGMSVERVAELTSINRWFLERIHNIADLATRLESLTDDGLPSSILREAKLLGFCDAQIAELTDTTETSVRKQRVRDGIVPCVRQIDTLAAEYPAQTNYLYLTYHATNNDVTSNGGKSVLVLGSGAYRIGSSVEFDWCCVTAVRTLRRLGYKTVMLNCNPETVSTDYDECDRLYFDEITLENVIDIATREDVEGVVVSMGGQTPNTLATKLAAAGVHILGTSVDAIDCAENRHRFSALCDEIDVQQPPWVEVTSDEAAFAFADRVGYPVLVRPSYVLSGAAMAVAETEERLKAVLLKAVALSPAHPTVISKFITGAKEIEVDAVASHGEIAAYAISEHIENAGVHSGDATLVLPPQRTYIETTRRAKQIARKLARALKINGPFNMQFIARDNKLMVIECNLRASRSFPFASKVFNVNFIELATRALIGEKLSKADGSIFELEYVGVKAPQFSFTRLGGADPVLGVEMASTGEVGCLGDDFDDAFLKAMQSVGYRVPVRAVLLSTGTMQQKAQMLESARLIADAGIPIFSTEGTAAFLAAAGVETQVTRWPLDSPSPNALDLIRSGTLDLVINMPKNATEQELRNDYTIRRAAVDHGIPLITNVQLAERFVSAIVSRGNKPTDVKSWREYLTHGQA